MQATGRAVCVAMLPLVLTSIAGCGTWQTVERRVTVAFPPAGAAPLGVRSSNGSIAVASGDGDQIVVNATIKARTRERADATQIVASLSPEGVYLIEARWPTPRAGNEGCSFDVATPPVSGVVLDTSNGGVTLSGLSGSARLDSSNGAIVVKGFAGEITADTSIGAISIFDATARVAADTSNGPIRVEMASASAGPVRLDTSNGSIDLVVGSGFAGTLTASTSNGSVSILAPGASAVQAGKRSGSATFGVGGEPSTLSTSNGSITVRSK